MKTADMRISVVVLCRDLVNADEFIMEPKFRLPGPGRTNVRTVFDIAEWLDIEDLNTQEEIVQMCMMANCMFLSSWLENEWDTIQSVTSRNARMNEKMKLFFTAQKTLMSLVR